MAGVRDGQLPVQSGGFLGRGLGLVAATGVAQKGLRGVQTARSARVGGGASR